MIHPRYSHFSVAESRHNYSVHFNLSCPHMDSLQLIVYTNRIPALSSTILSNLAINHLYSIQLLYLIIGHRLCRLQ